MKAIKILTAVLFGVLLGGFLGEASGLNPDILAAIFGVGGVAVSLVGSVIGTNFIETSLTWNGRQVYEAYIRPMFVGMSPLMTPGIRVMTDVVSKRKLNYFSAASKVLKKYTKGWTSPGNFSEYTQRDLDVEQMKAEASQDANEFYQTVYEELQGKGVEWNDLNAAPILKQLVIDAFSKALESDIYRIAWLADPYKETVSGGFYTGTADTDYNAITGFWKRIFDNATTTPTTDDHIKYVPIANGAVAQVDTLTFTGTGGTANVTVNGVAYLGTFDTDLATTAANFVTAHAAALALRGITLTYPGSGAAVVFTSAIAGQPFAAVTIANVTTNLSGTRAATTANTAPADLSADEAIKTFKSLYEGADKTLKTIPKDQKVLLVTDTMYENYLSTLEGQQLTAANTFTSEDGRSLIINGAEVLKYRGVAVVQMGWDVSLDADFPTGRPHRAIYTDQLNLILGIDSVSEFANLEFWYDKNEQENRWRVQLKVGTQYVHGKHTAVAY